jgi:hypothetical protein
MIRALSGFVVFMVLPLLIGATTWQTTDVPHGTVGSAYSATIHVTGGTPGYTYTVVGGRLDKCIDGVTATNLSINSSSGVISGTPSVSCYVDFTVHGCDSLSVCASPDREFSIGIFPVLDSYGGITGTTPPGCSGTFWKLAKINGHWIWESPTNCNVAYDMNVQDSQYGAMNSLGTSNYGGNQGTFYTNTTNHMVDWGFNAVGSFSITSSYTSISFIQLMRVWPYAVKFSGSYSYCSGADIVLKNFSSSSPTWVVGTNVLANLPSYTQKGQIDIFDPEFTNCASVAAAAAYTGGIATNPYKRAIMLDEIDEYFGKAFTSGYPDAAYLALVAQPCGSGGTSNAVCGSGNPLWTKYALTVGVSGINFGFGVGKGFLSNKYVNIAALNAAWGTNYSTFGSAGGWTASGSTSTGMLDENCAISAGLVHAGDNCTDPFTLSTLNANAQSDLETFDYWYAYDQYHTQVLAIQAQDSHNPVIMSNSYYGANGNPPHPCAVGPLNTWVLGFRDAIVNASAQGMIIGCHDPTLTGSSSEAVNKAMYNAACSQTSPAGVAGNCLPIEAWVSISANADSQENGMSTPYADFPTQHIRGQKYSGMVTDILNAQGSNGDYYSPGFQWWSLTDMASEGINFGLMSQGGNPYNGNASIIQAGLDYASVAQGGESGNWGQGEGQTFIGYVTQTNLAAVAAAENINTTTTPGQKQTSGRITFTGNFQF